MITAHAFRQVPTIRHGFFTREGGVSEGIYASLNCGHDSGDETARVATNRVRAVSELDLDPDSLCTVRQHHGTTVAVVNRLWQLSEAPAADAMVTKAPGVTLGVLTADCAPVLLLDEEAGIIGAAHAGWRGGLAGVIAAVVDAMLTLGAHIENLRAAVGPCLTALHYEVGPEFPGWFLARDRANRRYFRERVGTREQLFFDLPGFVADRLRHTGIVRVSVLNYDTYAQPDRFFSYRRACHNSEHNYGRALSAIALTG